MRELIAIVYGYDLTDSHPANFKGIRSAGSLKLDLRNIAKDRLSDLYFKKPDSGFTQNIGQLAFGVPNRWRGLFSMVIRDEDIERKRATIDIYVDTHRITVDSDLNDVKKLLVSSVEILKQIGVIESFEILGSKSKEKNGKRSKVKP